MGQELEEELRSKDAGEATAAAAAAFCLCRRCRRGRKEFGFGNVVNMGSTRNEKEWRTNVSFGNANETRRM